MFNHYDADYCIESFVSSTRSILVIKPFEGVGWMNALASFVLLCMELRMSLVERSWLGENERESIKIKYIVYM